MGELRMKIGGMNLTTLSNAVKFIQELESALDCDSQYSIESTGHNSIKVFICYQYRCVLHNIRVELSDYDDFDERFQELKQDISKIKRGRKS